MARESLRVMDMPTKEGTTGPWAIGDWVIDYAFNHPDCLEQWHIFQAIDPDGMPSPETMAKNMTRRILTKRAWRTRPRSRRAW